MESELPGNLQYGLGNVELHVKVSSFLIQVFAVQQQQSCVFTEDETAEPFPTLNWFTGHVTPVAVNMFLLNSAVTNKVKCVKRLFFLSEEGT